MKILLTFFSLLSLSSFGQDERYSELLIIAKEKGGIIVSSKPLTIKLDSWRLKHLSNKKRTDSIFNDLLISQIIDATHKWDTTKWSIEDFKKTVVITNRNEDLSANELLDK